MDTPSFDTWTSLFLLVVGIGLFLFMALLNSKQKKNLPIAFVILSFSLILFQYVLYWTRYENVFPYLKLLPHVCYYSVGPLLLLYFHYLFKNKISIGFVLHFIPAAVVFTTYSYILGNQLELIRAHPPFLQFAQNPWFVVAHLSIYCSLLFRYIIIGKKETETEVTRHKWSLLLSSLFLLFIIAYTSYYILVQFSFFNNEWDYAISLTMSFSIYTLGFLIIKQPHIFNGELFSNLFLPKSKIKNELDTVMLSSLYEKIAMYMKTEKPYRNNDLRMVQLADKVGISSHHLSKVINTGYGNNFNQFINEYRLDEAASLLLEFPNEPIQNIYYQSGFNNKVSFYSSFKERFNCTPAQYRTQSLSSMN